MALLGGQIVITLIMVTVIQKFGVHFSLARWMLCSTGLIRYLYPTDHELRTLAGVPKEKPKSRKERRQAGENGQNEKQTFHVPKNLEFELESAKVTLQDIVFLKYYTEYQWILDFAVYSLMVYVVSEIYTYFIPAKDEVNLSMVWCKLVLFFAYKVLFSLTVEYFRGEESMGERSTVIVTWFTYLLVAMCILIIDESILETGLENAYRSFNSSAFSFIEKQGMSSDGPASKLILKFFLALWCATVGALFTFPGLRMARMHWDAVKLCKENKMFVIGLNLSFIAPFVAVLLWLRPVSKHYLTVRLFSNYEKPILSEEAYDSLRLIFVVLAIVQRLLFMPTYLQAYLNLAHSRIVEQKKEAGRITNVDLQKKIAVVFYYMCVVSLQYIIPLIMCLFTLFLYKTLGGYSWLDFLKSHTPSDECPAVTPAPILENAPPEISLALSSLTQVLNREVLRGLFGFTTWWTLFAWFASSALGFLYQSYFIRS